MIHLHFFIAGAEMTAEEIERRYSIPGDILEKYRALGLCGAACEGQYGDEDIRRLSMILSLHDAGLSAEDTETYMRLWLLGDETKRERLAMLECLRGKKLEEIHACEAELSRIDYLRYRMRGEKK